MKLEMKMAIDTTWGNQIVLRAESELDNPHVLTTQEMSALMVHTLRLGLDEVRAENDRFRREPEPRTSEEALSERLNVIKGGEREQARYDEMRRFQDERERERAAGELAGRPQEEVE